MFINTNHLPINIVAKVVNGINVTEDNQAFNKMLELAKEYGTTYAGVSFSDIPGIQFARSFFRAIGLDPTRRRPSSEALLRRAVQGKDLYHINNVVDIGNWCSLEFKLPICVYDFDKIVGGIQVRIGTSKDSYIGHNQREMSFENKFVICDEQGAFGSPLTDSLRTAVTSSTSNLLLIIFAPLDYDLELLNKQMTIMEKRLLSTK